MSTVNKNSKNTIPYNGRIVKGMAKRHKCSARSIWQMVSGDRTPVQSDEIKKEYVRIYDAVENLVLTTDEQIDKLIQNPPTV